jgi:hypothetical protein
VKSPEGILRSGVWGTLEDEELLSCLARVGVIGLAGVNVVENGLTGGKTRALAL